MLMNKNNNKKNKIGKDPQIAIYLQIWKIKGYLQWLDKEEIRGEKREQYFNILLLIQKMVI